MNLISQGKKIFLIKIDQTFNDLLSLTLYKEQFYCSITNGAVLKRSLKNHYLYIQNKTRIYNLSHPKCKLMAVFSNVWGLYYIRPCLSDILWHLHLRRTSCASFLQVILLTFCESLQHIRKGKKINWFSKNLANFHLTQT